MKFTASIVALVALSVSLILAESSVGDAASIDFEDTAQRMLANSTNSSIIDNACTACQACFDAGGLCDPSLVQGLVCDNCDVFGVDNLCDACDQCTQQNVCDPNAIRDLGCSLCDINTDGDWLDWLPFDLCFSEVATVQVLGPDNRPTTTAMKNLKIGDSVLTQDGHYEKVYAFGHHLPTKTATFFQIHSAHAHQPLEVTPEHLIFKSLQGKVSPVPAKTVQVGDILVGAHGSDSVVTKIATIQRDGIYAPLTMGGTLLVDGVAASSYITLNQKQQIMSDHDLIHLTLSPYRLLCNGVSSTFCETRFHLDNGMPLYAYYGLELLRWLFQSNVVVKTIGLTVVLSLTGTSQLLETMLGASLAPCVLFLAGAVYASTNGQKKSKSKQV